MKMIFTKHNKTFSHSTFMISCRLFINCQKAGFSKTKDFSDALPSSILNLSNWKITIPFDANGKDGSEFGVAQEIKQTELNTYTQPNEVYPIIPPLLISKQDVKGQSASWGKNNKHNAGGAVYGEVVIYG